MSEHASSFENSEYTDSDSDSSCQESFNDLGGQSDPDFTAYDSTLEPIATAEQAAARKQERLQEEEEEREFSSRFSGEKPTTVWCECGNCSIELVMKPEECRCCREINACTYAMDACELEGVQCITLHPAFENGCLDPWVLRLPAIGLQTKSKRRYNELVDNGQRTETELMRAVAYRQLTRLAWGCAGRSIRNPLPCCAYHRIRKIFPSESYRGFEEEDDDNIQHFVI